MATLTTMWTEQNEINCKKYFFLTAKYILIAVSKDELIMKAKNRILLLSLEK